MAARLAVRRPTESSKLLSASKEKSLSAVTLTKKTVCASSRRRIYFCMHVVNHSRRSGEIDVHSRHSGMQNSLASDVEELKSNLKVDSSATRRGKQMSRCLTRRHVHAGTAGSRSRSSPPRSDIARPRRESASLSHSRAKLLEGHCRIWWLICCPYFPTRSIDCRTHSTRCPMSLSTRLVSLLLLVHVHGPN